MQQRVGCGENRQRVLVTREGLPTSPAQDLPDKVRLRETLGMIRHNRPLILLCASSLLFLTGMFSLQTVGVYYARDVLGNADLYIVLTVVQAGGMIAAAVIMPTAVEAIGKKRTYFAAGAITTAAGVAVTVAPGSVPAIGIACFGVLGYGLGTINTLIFALQADTVDYGEWKSGVRAEGSGYAVLSFTRKAGQGIGGAAAAFTIGLGGYVSGATSQTDTALLSISVAAGALPAGLILVATAVMLAYPLTEEDRQHAAHRGVEVANVGLGRDVRCRGPGGLRLAERHGVQVGGGPINRRHVRPGLERCSGGDLLRLGDGSP
jgi:Na+/melibiose symporter-like transporter